MYAPQQSSVVALHLGDYLQVLKSFQHTLLPQQELHDQFAALSVSGDKTVRWFKICFEQIEKAADKISGTLEAEKHTQEA
jgi:hypothetical protein